MEVVVKLDSLGVGVYKSGFGVNIFSASYVQVTSLPGKKPDTYGLYDLLPLGDDSSTLFFAPLMTSPIKLITPEEIQAFSPSSLIQTALDISISGTLLIHGKADITITRINKQGVATEILKRLDVRVSGGQLATTSIRGNLRKLP